MEKRVADEEFKIHIEYIEPNPYPIYPMPKRRIMSRQEILEMFPCPTLKGRK